MVNSIKVLKEGTISERLQCIEDLAQNNGTNITKEIPDKVGNIITSYCSNIITVEEAEKLLGLIGKLMDSGGDETIFLFAQSATFVDAVSEMIKGMEIRLLETMVSSTSKFSFHNHHCYELALFILLGIVEKSPLIKQFIKVIHPELLSSVVQSLSNIIQKDHLYITQVRELFA